MLQIKGLASSIRDVLGFGAARFDATGAASSSSQAKSPDEAGFPAVQRSIEGAAAGGGVAFQPPVDVPGGRGSAVDRNKVGTPTAVEGRKDVSGDSEKAVSRPDTRAPDGASSAEGEIILGGGRRGTAFQAQRIAQEVIPQTQGQAESGEGSPNAAQGFTALARRVATNLYGFVRDVVGGAAGLEGSQRSGQVLLQDGYSARVDLEA